MNSTFSNQQPHSFQFQQLRGRTSEHELQRLPLCIHSFPLPRMPSLGLCGLPVTLSGLRDDRGVSKLFSKSACCLQVQESCLAAAISRPAGVCKGPGVKENGKLGRPTAVWCGEHRVRGQECQRQEQSGHVYSVQKFEFFR